MISSVDTIDTTFETAYQAARVTNDLVNGVSNLLLAPCSSGGGLDTYKTQLSLVKTAMTALFSDITLKRTTLIASKNAYNQATRDLELTKAGTDPYKIKSQMALVEQARAQVAIAKSNRDKMVLSAPFSGSVSKVALSVGETVTQGKTVISLIATDGYEIVAKVPEIDIVKVTVGSVVDVSLDAYGKSVIFPATVTRISPSATTEGTVPMYEVVVTFNGSDPRIKQGMTANVSIITEDKKEVITVPSRFVRIISPSSGEVAVYKDGKESVRTIGLGIRGEDGLLEVTSGLLPGDEVIPPVTTVRQAQKQN
jgi:HlyD family secretion protein